MDEPFPDGGIHQMTAPAADQGIALSPPRTGTGFSPAIVLGIVAIIDVSVVLASGIAIQVAYVGMPGATLPIYLTALVMTSVGICTSFYFAKLYSFEALVNPIHFASKIIFVCLVVFMLLALLGFALKVSAVFSRVWFFSWWIGGTAFVVIGRLICFGVLKKLAETGRLTRNIVIFGTGPQAERLLSRLTQSKEPWNRVLGVFDDRLKRAPDEINSIPVLGTATDLIVFVRRNRVDDIVIALPWNADQRLFEVIDRLRVLPVDVHLGPDMAGLLFPGVSFSTFGRIPVLDVVRKPVSGWDIILKGLEDRLLGAILLIMAAPVMALIALAIRLESPGPALFRQTRYGFNNKEFTVYKFRSMDNSRAAEQDVPQAVKGDPRVTRLGQILRRFSLDELPQFINVVLGNMSLVGPRPHAVAHNEEYALRIHGYFARHRIKPGITGWAQVNGLRGETETLDKMQARVEYDIHYIENWSLMFDLRILIMTVVAVLFPKNAY